VTPVRQLADLFDGPGAAEYLGEPVTIGVHMRQAGALAAAAGAAPELIAAALLHDIGHLRGPRGDAGGLSPLASTALASTADGGHGDEGAEWLSQWFGPAVTEPVRLHVAAKRYLCAAEPDYFARLSAESVRTLAVQGGPMGAAQAAEFKALRYAHDAVAVRRWDDAAKDAGVEPPAFGHFAGLLHRLLRG
jgi:gamma-butyrobetaine dioxygenase